MGIATGCQEDNMTATTIATQQQPTVQVGETYNFHLPNGDRYIGEVDETNGKYVILRPGFTQWLIDEPGPFTVEKEYAQFNINDPRTVVYDASGEQI
jgi:hypothetical protein